MSEQTIAIDQYTSLALNEYKGTYSLVEGWINRDGEFKPQFCKRSFGKDKTEKTCPLSIKTGNKESIKKLAEFLLESIGETKDSDLPF